MPHLILCQHAIPGFILCWLEHLLIKCGSYSSIDIAYKISKAVNYQHPLLFWRQISKVFSIVKGWHLSTKLEKQCSVLIPNFTYFREVLLWFTTQLGHLVAGPHTLAVLLQDDRLNFNYCNSIAKDRSSVRLALKQKSIFVIICIHIYGVTLMMPL